ncbi:MAG TPA: SIMPL domain-containing protein [Candidatus Elarobacter sp.]|jgi:uncharacterized protein YggE
MRTDIVRVGTLICIVAGTLAGGARLGSAQSSTPSPAPAAAGCARPNIIATTLRPATAILPPIAEQQDINGTVQVAVSLDRDSNVVGARIMSSPSPVLNGVAIAAARATTFRSEIRDCRPIAGDYVYTVDFVRKATFASKTSGEQTVTVVGEGIATRPADIAFVLGRIVMHDDVAGHPTPGNDAAFDALKARLVPLGVGESDVRTTAYLQPPLSPGPGATGSRQIEIAVRNVVDVAHVVAVAASPPSVDFTAVRFALRERAAAYRDAVSAARKDAEETARDAVARQQHHLGALTYAEEPPNDVARTPTALLPLRLTPIAGGVKPPDVRIPDLEVRATVTVTYAVTP